MTQKQIDKLKKKLVIYLWGKLVTADAKKDAEMIMPFIVSTLLKQHSDLKEKIKKMRKEEPKSEGDGGRTDLYTLGCNQIIDDILAEMEK